MRSGAAAARGADRTGPDRPDRPRRGATPGGTGGPRGAARQCGRGHRGHRPSHGRRARRGGADRDSRTPRYAGPGAVPPRAPAAPQGSTADRDARAGRVGPGSAPENLPAGHGLAGGTAGPGGVRRVVPGRTRRTRTGALSATAPWATAGGTRTDAGLGRMTAAPAVGLYSIGVRGLSFPELLAWAAHHGVPHLHVRGGHRGYRLAGDPDAHRQLGALAEAAAVLGATTLRVFGRTSTESLQSGWAALSGLRTALSDCGAALAVELHAADWFDPGRRPAITDLLAEAEFLHLLTDTYQVQRYVPDVDTEFAAWLVARSRVVHFCDPGSGLTGIGHQRVATAVTLAAGAGLQPELAFEWTGPDRSAAGCLARYRAAVDWWEAQW